MRYLPLPIAACSFVLFLLSDVYSYYPSTLWSSNRINEHLVAIRTGSVMGDGGSDIVTISKNKLIIYRVIENQLFTQFQYKRGGRDEWFKLTLFDLEGDGQEEIIISGLYLDGAESIVGKIQSGKFQIMARAPYYLTTIPWPEKEVLVAQKKLGGDDFSGPLMEMVWNGKKLVKKEEITLPGGISGESISLYSVAGYRTPGQKTDGFLQLSPSGKLIHFFRQTDGRFKKAWTSGETYNGFVTALDVPVKNIMNDVQSKRFFVPTTFSVHIPEPVVIAAAPASAAGSAGATSAPLSPAVENPVVVPPGPPQVFVMKNYGYLKNVVGVETSVRNSQMVRLVWTGYGFQEDWNSPRLDGAISDFDLIDWDGDGKKEILALFLLRDKGYVDTLKNQDSLLIVIKTE